MPDQQKRDEPQSYDLPPSPEEMMGSLLKPEVGE